MFFHVILTNTYWQLTRVTGQFVLLHHVDIATSKSFECTTLILQLVLFRIQLHSLRAKILGACNELQEHCVLPFLQNVRYLLFLTWKPVASAPFALLPLTKWWRKIIRMCTYLSLHWYCSCSIMKIEHLSYDVVKRGWLSSSTNNIGITSLPYQPAVYLTLSSHTAQYLPTWQCLLPHQRQPWPYCCRHYSQTLWWRLKTCGLHFYLHRFQQRSLQ